MTKSRHYFYYLLLLILYIGAGEIIYERLYYLSQTTYNGYGVNLFNIAFYFIFGLILGLPDLLNQRLSKSPWRINKGVWFILVPFLAVLLVFILLPAGILQFGITNAHYITMLYLVILASGYFITKLATRRD